MLVVLIFLITSRSDYARVSYLDNVAGKHKFSLALWEIQHLPLKWSHLVWEMFPGNKPSDEERKEIGTEYLSIVRKLNIYEEQVSTSQTLSNPKYLSAIESLEIERKMLKARAEEAIESILSEVIQQQGLGLPFGILLPPTDFHFGSPPHILVTSPRDVIKLSGTKLINPSITGAERHSLEKSAESDGKTSALVDDLAGIGTYPAIVSDSTSLRNLLRTAAHEWLHNYWILHPLGRNMWDSTEMRTINETSANIAGNEIGDLAFQLMGEDLSDSINKYKHQSALSHWDNQLIETRKEVDRLLSLNEIEKAEKLMKEKTWELRLAGYGVRKINQAYFAFRGQYADGPASTSTAGKDLQEYRSYFPDVGSFIRSISTVSSNKQFLELLNGKRGDDPNPTALQQHSRIRE